MRRIGMALIVSIWIAGCTSQGDGTPTPPVSDQSFGQLLLTGCKGGVARMQVPEQLVEVPVPPGWEGENGLPTTITIWPFQCDHVSFGPFERGPIDFVLESHGKFSAPMNCRVGEYVFLNILTRMIWSDAEVAAAMHERLGIPTSVGTVQLQETGERSVASTHELSWQVDGLTSSFTVGRFENDYSDLESIWRYVWPAGDRLGFVDFHWAGPETWLEPTATYGSFSEPMLLAQAGLPIVVGTGALEEDIVPSGQFKFYEGYECAKELPSP